MLPMIRISRCPILWNVRMGPEHGSLYAPPDPVIVRDPKQQADMMVKRLEAKRQQLLDAQHLFKHLAGQSAGGQGYFDSPHRMMPSERTSPSASATATAIVSAWTSRPKNRSAFIDRFLSACGSAL
jgi:hypothetical protein